MKYATMHQSSFKRCAVYCSSELCCTLTGFRIGPQYLRHGGGGEQDECFLKATEPHKTACFLYCGSKRPRAAIASFLAT